MSRFFIGLIISFIISYAAFRRKSLSYSGFIGALILGTSLYFFGRIYLLALMLGFFLSSSLLTKYKEEDKSAFEDINEKSGGRDYLQVIANGGLGLVYALLYYFTKSPLFILGYAASFAAANADTWSSEVGVLSQRPPVSILNFKKTDAGNSGAISLLGITAAFCGSFFIAFIFLIGYILTAGWDYFLFYYFVLIILTGFSGSIIDSYLGVLIQAKYRCPVCGKITEKKVHHGKTTELISGLKFINNDVVNFLSCMVASILAVTIAYFLGLF